MFYFQKGKPKHDVKPKALPAPKPAPTAIPAPPPIEQQKGFNPFLESFF
jgi:hypothetical protein